MLPDARIKHIWTAKIFKEPKKYKIGEINLPPNQQHETRERTEKKAEENR